MPTPLSMLPVIPTRPAPSITMLAITAIAANPLQPRKTFDDLPMQELVASIREHGVLQPVLVTQSLSGYRLVVGERRWRAAQAAGMTRIPAVVCDYAEVDALQVALVENLQRQDLNPIEEAQAIQFLLKEHRMTQDALAARLGKSRSALSNTTRLLQLPHEVQQDVVTGGITAGHARALLGLADPTLQLKAWHKVRQDGLSVRQTEALVRRWQAGPVQRMPRQTPEQLLEAQEELERRLQASVRIRPRSKQGGRIELRYDSIDELDRLLDTLYRAGRNAGRRADLELL